MKNMETFKKALAFFAVILGGLAALCIEIILLHTKNYFFAILFLLVVWMAIPKAVELWKKANENPR